MALAPGKARIAWHGRLPVAVRPFLLSIVSLLVFVLAAEGLVRLMGPDLTLPGDENRFRFSQDTTAEYPHHVRDDELGWRLKPDQQGALTTNRHGFRTPDFDLEPDPARVRVLFVGDSNPLGFGLTDDAAPYPARVQRLFDDFYEHGRIESINLGVDGYSSHQARILLDHYLSRLQPQFVCIQVGFNDYCLAPVSDRDHAFHRPALLDGLERSHAYRWLRRVLLGITGAGESSSRPVPRVDPDQFETNLRTMIRAVRSTGAVAIVLTTPVRPAVPLVINEIEVTDGDEVEWTTQDKWMRRRLNDAGIDPDAPDDPRYVSALEVMAAEHPDWPILPFMLARAHRDRGEVDAAARYEAAWRALDQERQRLETYMERARRDAEEEGAVIVDVERVLRGYLESEAGRDAPTDLYIDFVHLDARGHVVVATEIARIIGNRLDPTPS